MHSNIRDRYVKYQPRRKRRCERSRWSHQSISYLSFCEQNSSSCLEQEYGTQGRSGRQFVSLQRLQWRRTAVFKSSPVKSQRTRATFTSKAAIHQATWRVKESGHRRENHLHGIIWLYSSYRRNRYSWFDSPHLPHRRCQNQAPVLPGFSTVTDWSKNRRGVRVDFTFMNLLLYLVYGRDKTFDMQSMQAFKSLLKLVVFSQMGLSAMSGYMTAWRLGQG